MSNKIVSPPRDAGFFSVFNFFIGLLSTDVEAYPFWNESHMTRANGINTLQHFCYLNKEIENSWFEFFKPISYQANDDTHTQLTSLNVHHYKHTQHTPYEFELPRKEHFRRADISDWREKIHAYFSKYIALSDNVTEMLNGFVSRYFPCDGTPVISVHYRHPSHSCEEGFVPLKNYFKRIDEILSNHPEAHIFLATDTYFGVLAFKDKYGDKLFYNKYITRTSLDNLLEWAHARGNGSVDGVGFINNKGYELQHVFCAANVASCKMGYDVLIDAICLSKCDWFVHTLSNLSLAVSYMNPKIEMILVNN